MAKKQGGILAKLTNHTEIIGITKENWIKFETKIITVREETYYYGNGEFYFPKCCCEVIED